MPTEAYSPQRLVEQPKRPPKKAGRALLIAAAAVLVLAAAGGGIVWAAYQGAVALPEPIQTRIDLLPEVNAREGTPNAGTSGAASGPGEFQIVLNQVPTVALGERTCNIQMENPAGNFYDLRLVLTLDETGETLAATHRIEPGKRVDELSLYQELGLGEYPVTATLELYSGGEAAGSLDVPVTLRVVEEVSE